MNIGYFLLDIERIKCMACQELMRYLLKPGWQNIVYHKAEKEVSSGQHRDNYLMPLTSMKRIGVDKYDVLDMDLSFIRVVVFYIDRVLSITLNPKTKNYLVQLIDDRNENLGHRNYNESVEDLHKRGILALENLKRFVNLVSTSETDINDSFRKEYQRRYLEEIDDLYSKFDFACNHEIHIRNEINEDISELLRSEEQGEELFTKTWIAIYCDKYSKKTKNSTVILNQTIDNLEENRDHGRIRKLIDNLEENKRIENCFLKGASDKGIGKAHLPSAKAFFFEGNYLESSRRIEKQYPGFQNVKLEDAFFLVQLVNESRKENNRNAIPENRITMIIDCLKKQGYSIMESENNQLKLQTQNS